MSTQFCNYFHFEAFLPENESNCCTSLTSSRCEGNFAQTFLFNFTSSILTSSWIFWNISPSFGRIRNMRSFFWTAAQASCIALSFIMFKNIKSRLWPFGHIKYIIVEAKYFRLKGPKRTMINKMVKYFKWFFKIIIWLIIFEIVGSVQRGQQ